MTWEEGRKEGRRAQNRSRRALTPLSLLPLPSLSLSLSVSLFRLSQLESTKTFRRRAPTPSKAIVFPCLLHVPTQPWVPISDPLQPQLRRKERAAQRRLANTPPSSQGRPLQGERAQGGGREAAFARASALVCFLRLLLTRSGSIPQPSSLGRHSSTAVRLSLLSARLRRLPLRTFCLPRLGSTGLSFGRDKNTAVTFCEMTCGRQTCGVRTGGVRRGRYTCGREEAERRRSRGRSDRSSLFASLSVPVLSNLFCSRLGLPDTRTSGTEHWVRPTASAGPVARARKGRLDQ